ncbi:hypothetical protein GL2_06960 [Microbulbifer sp. GL-2]|nr:hypothetical protein GL2_06960 [Microbulbifer sp. GL-2]
MVDSKRPSSSATCSAAELGASFGALPALSALLPGWPALALLLLEDALLEELLDAELLDEELEDEAVCSSSEKSISSGGVPSSPDEGSDGVF